MADSSFVRELKAGLRSRLAEVERALAGFDALVAERDSLRATLAALGEGGVGASRRRAGSGRRAGRGARREQVLAVVAARPGARPSAIAKELGIASSQVHGLLRKLADEGAVVKADAGGWMVPTPGTPPRASQPGGRQRAAKGSVEAADALSAAPGQAEAVEAVGRSADVPAPADETPDESTAPAAPTRAAKPARRARSATAKRKASPTASGEAGGDEPPAGEASEGSADAGDAAADGEALEEATEEAGEPGGAAGAGV